MGRIKKSEKRKISIKKRKFTLKEKFPNAIKN